jgi:hypothetical protein
VGRPGGAVIGEGRPARGHPRVAVKVGEVRIYDPMSSSIPQGTTALWSPLQQAGTVGGAQRAARALCDAAPRRGVEGGMDFWLAQAEILLSGLLFIAYHGNRTWARSASGCSPRTAPTDAGDGEVYDALKTLR